MAKKEYVYTVGHTFVHFSETGERTERRDLSEEEINIIRQRSRDAFMGMLGYIREETEVQKN